MQLIEVKKSEGGEVFSVNPIHVLMVSHQPDRQGCVVHLARGLTVVCVDDYEEVCEAISAELGSAEGRDEDEAIIERAFGDSTNLDNKWQDGGVLLPE